MYTENRPLESFTSRNYDKAKILDDIKNRTDEGGKFSLVTNNSDSRDDDEYDEVGIEVKTPLFLQMEMQVWASLPNPSDIVNGHQIPLRRGFKYFL